MDGSASTGNKNCGAGTYVDETNETNMVNILLHLNELCHGSSFELEQSSSPILGSVIVVRNIVEPETGSGTAEQADFADCCHIDICNRAERGRRQVRYLPARLSPLGTGMIKKTLCRLFSNRYSIWQKFVSLNYLLNNLKLLKKRLYMYGFTAECYFFV